MNGECTTVKLNEPMTWDQFKSISFNLQTNYLNHLIVNHGASLYKISNMFGLSNNALGNYVRKYGLNVTSRKTGHPTEDSERRWRAFLDRSAMKEIDIGANLNDIEAPGEYVIDYSKNPDGEFVERPKELNPNDIQPVYPLCLEYTLDGVTDWKGVMDKLGALGTLLDQGKYPIGSYRVTLRVQRED